MTTHARFFFCTFFILAFGTHVQAQVLKEQLKVSEKRWGVSSSLSSSTSLHNTDDYNHSAETRITIAPNYRITDDLKITASLSGLQQMDGGKKSSMSNTRVSLQKSPMQINPDLMWFPTVLTDLPTNVESRKLSGYRGNLGIQATGIQSLRLFEQNFSLIPLVRYTHNFHRYTRTASDAANINRTALGAVYLETGLMKNVTLTVGGNYTYGWTYQTSTREYFGFSQEVTYAFNKALTLAAGHSNDAEVFAADGRTTNVNLFNDNTSTVYMTLKGVY